MLQSWRSGAGHHAAAEGSLGRPSAAPVLLPALLLAHALSQLALLPLLLLLPMCCPPCHQCSSPSRRCCATSELCSAQARLDSLQCLDGPTPYLACSSCTYAPADTPSQQCQLRAAPRLLLLLVALLPARCCAVRNPLWSAHQPGAMDAGLECYGGCPGHQATQLRCAQRPPPSCRRPGPALSARPARQPGAPRTRARGAPRPGSCRISVTTPLM